jgi:hypothetical protein
MESENNNSHVHEKIYIDIQRYYRRFDVGKFRQLKTAGLKFDFGTEQYYIQTCSFRDSHAFLQLANAILPFDSFKIPAW